MNHTVRVLYNSAALQRCSSNRSEMIPPRVYFHQLQEQQKQLTCGAATGELCSGQLATGHRTNPHYHDASGHSPASSSTATPARLQSSGVNQINNSSASGQQSYQSGDCQLDIESKRLQPTGGQLSNSTCIYSDGRTSQLHHQPSQLHHQPSQLHHQLTHEQRQQQSNFSCAQQSDSERLLERQLYQQQINWATAAATTTTAALVSSPT